MNEQKKKVLGNKLYEKLRTTSAWSRKKKGEGKEDDYVCNSGCISSDLGLSCWHIDLSHCEVFIENRKLKHAQ